MALCSLATPKEHQDYMAGGGVDVIVAGKHRVDLDRALGELHERYGVSRAADIGGTLSAALLKEGLIDEISIILTSCLMGNLSNNLLMDPKIMELTRPLNLRLRHMEEMKGRLVCLRYYVHNEVEGGV